jgi:hypothetical protein
MPWNRPAAKASSEPEPVQTTTGTSEGDLAAYTDTAEFRALMIQPQHTASTTTTAGAMPVSGALAGLVAYANEGRPIEPAPDTGPVLRPITALDDLPEKDKHELIGDRFVCAGGAVLLAAPTGIGKSTFVSGMVYHFGAGLPYMGLRPLRPLLTWMIGAENDDHDQRDFIRGAEYQLRRENGEDKLRLARKNLFFAQVNTLAGIALADWLRGLLDKTPAKARPDLLVLDPAFAYIGGDALKQADVSAFLRGMLNPVLTEYKLGLVLIHHCNKPRRQEPGAPAPDSDGAYLGSGSAEFGNWARGVLSILPSKIEGVFELKAGKRGGRLGWTNSNGVKTCKRYIAHSSESGDPFFWRDATPEEAAGAAGQTRERQDKPDLDALADIAKRIVCKGPVTTKLFDAQLARQAKIGQKAATSARGEVIDMGTVSISRREPVTGGGMFIGLPAAIFELEARWSNPALEGINQ